VFTATAPAFGHSNRPRLWSQQPPPPRRPTRLGRTPIEGAAPEIEPVDRDAILVEDGSVP